MKDRVVQHPSRYQLVPVSGTTDTYDLVPVPGTVTEEGTPLNKASLLKDTTAALVGLGISALPDEALRAAALKTKGKLIQSYTVAGTYTWTAPDLNDGADYEVGVLIIGGGGSGGAIKYYTSSTVSIYAEGGASGFTKIIKMTVTPGDEIAVIVGAGGAYAKTTTANRSTVQGNDGGSSSFNGNAALGGDGGFADYSTPLATSQPLGAQTPTLVPGANTEAPNSGDMYGGVKTIVLQCLNVFELIPFLSAGGGAKVSIPSGLKWAETATTVFFDGLSGSPGLSAWKPTTNTINIPAESVGCGGGGVAQGWDATPNTTLFARSGKGADGGVFIYV